LRVERKVMEDLGSNNMIQPKTILYGTAKYALTYGRVQQRQACFEYSGLVEVFNEYESE